jgi:alpha-tubulin suppressor-like RCC1 family protein
MTSRATRRFALSAAALLWLAAGCSVPRGSQQLDVQRTNIAAGGGHSCAQRPDGQAYCWGMNHAGQLGDGTTTSAPRPTVVRPPPAAALSGLTAGDSHTCAQGSDGQAYCWGHGSGQLGDGTDTDRLVPAAVVIPDGVTLAGLTAGREHTCAEGSDGRAYCWGANASGRLGDGTDTDRRVPTAVQRPAGAATLTGLAAGDGHTCAQGSDGRAYCWGMNRDGQLGDGTATHRLAPTAVNAPAGVALSGLTAGRGHTCAQGSDGQAYCWGGNVSGQLGDGTGTERLVPTPVQTPAGVTLSSLTAGASHTCAHGSDGRAYCWGLNGSGQLGDGASGNRRVPTAVYAPAGVTLSGLAAGDSHTCAGGSDGQVYCWGFNHHGQLGDGTTEARRTPVIVTFAR